MLPALCMVYSTYMFKTQRFLDCLLKFIRTGFAGDGELQLTRYSVLACLIWNRIRYKAVPVTQFISIVGMLVPGSSVADP
jgi:hypothetical protein